MNINSLTKTFPKIPNPSTLAFAVCISMQSVQAEAAEAVIVEPSPREDTRSGGEKYTACIQEEDKRDAEERKAQRDKRWAKYDIPSPVESAIEGQLPSDISKPIFDTLSQLQKSFQNDFSGFNSTSRSDMAQAQKILDTFFESLYDVRQNYTDISQPGDAEFFQKRYNISAEEAQEYEVKDREYYFYKLEKANEAQRVFIDSVPDKTIHTYYDLIDAVQQSDDSKTKESLATLFDFAKIYARSGFLTDSKLIRENNQFNDSVWESVSQQYNERQKYNREVIYPQQHDVLDKLGRQLFPEKQQKELTSIELEIIGQLEGYITDQNTSISFDTFLKTTQICIPDFIDVSVLSNSFMKQLQNEYKNIPRPKNNDFEELEYRGSTIDDLFAGGNGRSEYLANLKLLRYDIPVETVLGNFSILLDIDKKTETNPRKAYIYYQRYFLIRELLDEFRENQRLQGHKQAFQKIYREVRIRQNFYLCTYQNGESFCETKYKRKY